LDVESKLDGFEGQREPRIEHETPVLFAKASSVSPLVNFKTGLSNFDRSINLTRPIDPHRQLASQDRPATHDQITQ
jgi:hypothetical protein